MERKRIESSEPHASASPQSADDGERRPGRPRSDEAHAAILAASIALIREVGYDAVTMEAIAARAGVGKATVYRRWAGKETLVAEALKGIVSRLPVPDTGSTAGDLLMLTRGTLSLYHDPATLGLLTGLIAAMARSEVIAQAVRSGFVAARIDVMRHLLRRGIDRGDLRADADMDLAVELLAGPLLHRALITAGPMNDDLARGTVDVVMRGLAP
jgi:AcrR family transcriptional regulator